MPTTSTKSPAQNKILLSNHFLDDVKNLKMKIFKMSKKTENVLHDALDAHDQKRTHNIQNIDDFLDSLSKTSSLTGSPEDI